jgi:hypothetical protein
MKMLVTASVLAALFVISPASADTNAGPSTPQVLSPGAPVPKPPESGAADSNGTVPRPDRPDNKQPNIGSGASGSSAGTTGLSGPYNPTPPATNPGAAVQ